MHVDQRTAHQAMVRLAHDADLEFIRERTKTGPLFAFMYESRRMAIEALVNLAHVDPIDAEGVRKLQNEVQRFIDVLAFVRGLFDKGYESAKILKTDDADELRELVGEDDQVSGED